LEVGGETKSTTVVGIDSAGGCLVPHALIKTRVSNKDSVTVDFWGNW